MFPQLPFTVHTIMSALTDGLVTIFGDRLVGVYLGGSAAAGDFCEAASDIDFLVVTDSRLSPEDEIAVTQLHRELRQRLPLSCRLEGDYAPATLLVPEGTVDPVPGCERGVFLPRVGEVMLSADNICDMREHGLAFYGPGPCEVLPTVTQEQVRSAVRRMLRDGPGSCETPAEAAAEILNLARSACALEQGRPVTRVEGARWAIARLGDDWRPVFEAALAVRCGEGTLAQAEMLGRSLQDLESALGLKYRC